MKPTRKESILLDAIQLAKRMAYEMPEVETHLEAAADSVWGPIKLRDSEF